MAALETSAGKFLWPFLVLLIAFTVNYIIEKAIGTGYNVPPELPWIGKDSTKFFAGARSSIAISWNLQKWLSDGYTKYNKQGLSYVLPGFLTKPEIVIPLTSIKWMMESPSDVLSANSFHADLIYGGKYIFPETYILKDVFHIDLIYRHLPKRAIMAIPEIDRELVAAIDHIWGINPSSWHEMNIYRSTASVVTRVTNYFIAGPDLCRDQKYLDVVTMYTTGIYPVGATIAKLPFILRHILGPLIAIPMRYYLARATKICTPVIEERKRNIAKKLNDPTYRWEAPNDYLTWHITQALLEDRQSELDPSIITSRIMLVNIAANHTTSLVIAENLRGLYSSDISYVEGIREEVTRIYNEDNKVWVKAGLARMVRTDSSIREALRLTTVLSRLARKVVSKEGIKNEVEGYSLEPGSYLTVNIRNVHYDPDFYENPDVYDAFRFSRLREETGALKTLKRDPTEARSSQALDLLTTGGFYYAFGYGKHACPGRFFVNNFLKLMLAHIVMKYDVEKLAKPVPVRWIGDVSARPTFVNIKVRRKKAASE